MQLSFTALVSAFLTVLVAAYQPQLYNQYETERLRLLLKRGQKTKQQKGMKKRLKEEDRQSSPHDI